jgi:hypothetical protein
MRMNLRIIACGLVIFALAGCQKTLRPGPSYPSTIERLGAVDVQVVTRRGVLEFTNTTAEPLPAGRLWVNAWFSAPTERVEVGETFRVPISALHDEHGETMRGEGFFATEAPEEIYLAELQTNAGLTGLVVVRN